MCSASFRRSTDGYILAQCQMFNLSRCLVAVATLSWAFGCLGYPRFHRRQNNGQQKERTAMDWIIWAVPSTGPDKSGLYKSSHRKSMDIQIHNEQGLRGSLNSVLACNFPYRITTLYQHDDLTLSFLQLVCARMKDLRDLACEDRLIVFQLQGTCYGQWTSMNHVVT